VDNLEACENFYEEFYPGDNLAPRAVSIVTAILAEGPLDVPESPRRVAL
jgi:hypothetical protein